MNTAPSITMLVEHDGAPAWRSRDGRITAVADLGDDHLRNILRMLFRSAFAIELVKVSGMPEEFAWHHDPIVDRAPSESLRAELPQSSVLLEEWARRGFTEEAWTQGVLS